MRLALCAVLLYNVLGLVNEFSLPVLFQCVLPVDLLVLLELLLLAFLMTQLRGFSLGIAPLSVIGAIVY